MVATGDVVRGVACAGAGVDGLSASAPALIDVHLLAQCRSFATETPFPTSTALRIRLGT
jgi:hypothetical protein